MNKKVLLIEDDTTLATITSERLEAKGFNTHICFDSTCAKKEIENFYDIIILDINLPSSNGFDLCNYIREKSIVPIIFVSARSSVTDKTHALDIGGDDYLEKPYSIEELVSRINAVTRRSKVAKIIEFDNIMINLETRELFRLGTKVKLTNKEFELLKYLVENKNKSLSKENIFINVWGEYNEVEDSTISVHIRWLREKLEVDASKPKYIKTIYGFGYVMVIEWKK